MSLQRKLGYLCQNGRDVLRLNLINHIHILGASGSGTTTLARALANSMGYEHYDSDNFFWLPTTPPFQKKRELPERQRLLLEALQSCRAWTLSGSLCGWGDFTIPMFDLVVFLYLPKEIRLERLIKRETERYGPDIRLPKHPRHEAHKVFLQWAAAYDEGGLDMRSKSTHEKWLSSLPCPLLRIEGEISVESSLDLIFSSIQV